MPDQPAAASSAAAPAKAIPVVVTTPDDPVMQAILAALNTALAAIHAWGLSSTPKA